MNSIARGTQSHDLANALELINNLVFLTREDAHRPERVAEYMKLAETSLQSANEHLKGLFADREDR